MLDSPRWIIFGDKLPTGPTSDLMVGSIRVQVVRPLDNER